MRRANPGGGTVQRVTDRSAALAAVSEALLGIAGDLRTDAVLERLVEAARGLAGARYAALGVPDEEGDGFSRWISAGLTDEEIDAIGPLPRTHGLLGAALHDPAPSAATTCAATTASPAGGPPPIPTSTRSSPCRSCSAATWWPPSTWPTRTAASRADDERLVGDLAAHAAVLIEHARLYEASQELSVLEERNRLARELHDALTQSLFGLRLRLEAGDDAGAGSLLEDIFAELRSLILQLRPPALELDGLVPSLAKHLDVSAGRTASRTRLEATTVGDLDRDTEQALFRIAQEAVTNVVRHAAASR